MPLDSPSKPSFRLLAAALVVGLFLPVAACTDDEPGSVVTGGPSQTFDAGSAVSMVATDPLRCTDPNYYVALAVSTTVAAEVPLLRDVAACTDTSYSALWLKNSGEVVWTTTTVRGGDAVQYSDPGMVGAFAAHLKSDAALLLPGHSIVVMASPEAVEWNYDVGASVGWSMLVLLMDEIMEKAPGEINDWLNAGSVRGHAVGTCVVAAATMATASLELISADRLKPSDVLTAVLGASSGSSSCYDEWRAAERVRVDGTLTVTADDLVRLPSKRSAQLVAVDEGVTLAFRMKSLGTRVLKFAVRLR